MTPSPDDRTEANPELIRLAFDAWRDGTGAITDVFAPDMMWRIEGHSSASKEYRDKQQFIDEALAPFGARFSARTRSARSRSVPSTPTPIDVARP